MTFIGSSIHTTDSAETRRPGWPEVGIAAAVYVLLFFVVPPAVFALAHGIDLALISAVIVGLISSLLFLRTKSVWPGVIVHAVNNGMTTLLSLAFAGLAT